MLKLIHIFRKPNLNFLAWHILIASITQYTCLQLDTFLTFTWNYFHSFIYAPGIYRELEDIEMNKTDKVPGAHIQKKC